MLSTLWPGSLRTLDGNVIAFFWSYCSIGLIWGYGGTYALYGVVLYIIRVCLYIKYLDTYYGMLRRYERAVCLRIVIGLRPKIGDVICDYSSLPTMDQRLASPNTPKH